jgi:hypothetical protein
MTLTPTSIPATEPELVYAGATIQWTKSGSDYPSDEYTLNYYLSGPANITITGSQYESGTDHLISVTAAVSNAWDYGRYSYQAYAEKTGEKWFVGSGFITIKTAAGKSFAKTMLDAIEAILGNRADKGTVDMVAKGLGDKNIQKRPDLLMTWRDKFRAEVSAETASEDRAQGRAAGSKVLLRFRRPS